MFKAPETWICSWHALFTPRGRRSFIYHLVHIEYTNGRAHWLFLIIRDRRYHLDKPILTSLAQFAIAILYDLGLDKPSASDSGLLLEYDLKGLPRPSQTMSPTPQERRALLGCFYLSSV